MFKISAAYSGLTSTAQRISPFAVATLALSACLVPSQDQPEDQRLGVAASELISPAVNNHLVSGTFQNQHETAVTYVKGTDGGTTAHWIAAWNTYGDASIEPGWARSSDGSATSFTAHQMTSGLDWGNPGVPPSGAGRTFRGWRGDPAVAAVTDPAISNNGARALYTNVAVTKDDAVNNHTDDAVIAFTNDGGSTWQGASYVNDAATSGRVDMPAVASNPIAPFDSYVGWETTQTSYLRKVYFDTGGVLHRGSIAALPPIGTQVSDQQPRRLSLGFGVLPAGCTSGKEGVFIVSTPLLTACAPSLIGQSIQAKWFLTVYDPTANAFYGPWLLDQYAAFPHCVTSDNTGNNVVDAHIAVDPTSSNFWVTHAKTTFYGTRIGLDFGSIVCTNGRVGINLGHATDPDPCNPSLTGACQYTTDTSTGASIFQDEWEPAIGFAVDPITHAKRVTMTWYGTRNDVHNALASYYYSVSENGGAFSIPAPVALNAGVVATWKTNHSGTEDFTRLGADYSGGRFLAVWAGDARSWAGLGYTTIQSDILQ
jgi:hypothetical protein